MKRTPPHRPQAFLPRGWSRHPQARLVRHPAPKRYSGPLGSNPRLQPNATSERKVLGEGEGYLASFSPHLGQVDRTALMPSLDCEQLKGRNCAPLDLVSAGTD